MSTVNLSAKGINFRLVILAGGLSIFTVGCKLDSEPLASDLTSVSPSDRDVNSLRLYKYSGSVNDSLSDSSRGGASLIDPMSGLALDDASASASKIMDGRLTDVTGWPAQPRKSASHDVSTKNEFSMYFGVSAKFLDVVEAASVGTVAMGAEVSKQLMLAKHTPNNEDLTYIDGDRKVQLKLDDKQPFVVACTFEALARETLRWNNTLKFMGNGMGNDTSLVSTTKVSIFSDFFKVKPTDTIETLIDFCQEIYATRVQRSIKAELQRQIVARSQVDSTKASTEALAIRAALWGPRVDRISLHTHHWNVKVADVIADGKGKVTVQGRLDHSIQVQLDDYADYKCEATNLQESVFEIRNKQRSLIFNWKSDAEKLVRAICNDAYVEFRNTKYQRINGVEG